jgi:TonB-linked SusC/RagA family outer membrane protein
MKKRYYQKGYLIALFLLFIIGETLAQGVQVKGTITDETGAPVPGASIVVKGTTNGTVSNTEGRYTLNLTNASSVLTVTYIGYLTKEVAVGNRTVVDVQLAVDAQDLDQVVVVGYTSQKKVNVIGSVTAISGDKLTAIPSPDVNSALSGRLPGVTIAQASGEPGNNAAKIMIRGRTTLGSATGPLIVVDGVPGRALNEIDPVDIESISVLKDASAAIYGTQAANGVILVTTKKGKDGKPRLDYQFYQGFMAPTILPKVLNSGDYATMLSEYQVYEGKPRTYTKRDIELFYSGIDPWEHPNTDWMNELVADWTTSKKHNITIDGGNKGVNYYFSLGYKDEQAIYKQESTKYGQYNTRAKLDIPITDWLKTSVDYAGFITNKLYPTRGAGDIYGASTRLLPTQWAFWPSGEPGPDIEYGDNPVVTSTLQGGSNDNKNYKNQATFRVSIAPPMIKGLSLDGYFSYDVENRYQKIFRKPWTLYSPNWSSAKRNADGFITEMEVVPNLRGYNSPELQENYERDTRILANTSFTYSREFKGHAFSLFGAYEQIEENSNTFGAFRKYFISDAIQSINAGSNTEKDNSGSASIYARKSWIGRLNYNYKDRYLAEFLVRRDGSIKFAPDGRWGNFPAVLLGWRASEEEFWKKNLSFINFFKLRATYGKMGMDPGAAFQYMNKYGLFPGVAFGEGKDIETIVRQASVANPFITWEKQTTKNIGFDSYFMNNMFHLNVDYFQNRRSDILVARNASVPGFTGLALPDENIGIVDNHGFELEAGFHKQINSDLKFDLSGNISWNRNKVVFMDEPKKAVDWQRLTGHPFGAVLLYKSIGIFADQAAVDAYPHWTGAKAGDVIFEDHNGDGKITSDDMILLDKANAPEIFYGISLDVTYKSFTLSVLAQGQGTYYQQNFADARRGEAGNYFQWNFDQRWTPENTQTNVARAFNRSDQYWGFDVNKSTYWYDNMAYFRLKSAVLNYTLPKDLLRKVGISQANVFASTSNPFLIYAAQKNFDPEIAQPMNYPAIKTFAIGAKVTF